jgi:hypothetical protein
MFNANRLLALALISSATGLCSCNSTEAHLAPAPQSAPTAKSTVSAFPPVSHPLSKQPPREGAFSLYNNPELGISLRYPRNYLLDEELDPNDSSGLMTQHDWESQQPGAILVATLRIPDDAYPNTTFAAGHVQIVVNPSVTAALCRSFVAPPDAGWAGATEETTLQGVSFYWRDRGSISNDAVSAARDYAGFSANACYELVLEVSSASPSGSDPLAAPADLSKILRPLEKIVSSVQIHRASARSSNR